MPAKRIRRAADFSEPPLRYVVVWSIAKETARRTLSYFAGEVVIGGVSFTGGTKSSNPLSSSAESIANSIFCGPASTTKQWPSLGTSSATRPLATHRERLRPGEPTDRVDHRESGGDGALRVVLTAKYMGDGVLIYFGYPQAPSSRTAARWNRAAVGGDRSRRFPGRVDPPAGPSLERAVSLTQSPAEI